MDARVLSWKGAVRDRRIVFNQIGMIIKIEFYPKCTALEHKRSS